MIGIVVPSQHGITRRFEFEREVLAQIGALFGYGNGFRLVIESADTDQ